MEVGRLAVKLAGRDAGKKCVIVEVLKNNFVTIDGATRRRKCNLAHLFMLNDKVDVNEKASHEDVKNALKEKGIEVRETNPKKPGEKPQKKSNSKKKADSAKKSKTSKKTKSTTESKKESQSKTEEKKTSSKTTKESNKDSGEKKESSKNQ